MTTDFQTTHAAQTRSAAGPLVCDAASVWAICIAQKSQEKKLNVSCSIRDSTRLFALVFDPGGFSVLNGKTPLLARHTVLEFSTIKTFSHLLAVAHTNLEPAYSE